MMAYSLVRLALGSYDALRDAKVIGELVRSGSTPEATWAVELLQGLPLEDRPAPFIELEHTFNSLEKARLWLGAAELMPAEDTRLR